MVLLTALPYTGPHWAEFTAFLSTLAMSENQTEGKTSFTKEWGSSLKKTKALFKPEDFDIFCDKHTGMTYIFHGPELGCTIDFMEYNPDNQRVTVFTKDGQKLDLGVRIQWLIRPYFAKAQMLYIIRTKDGQPLDGVEIPLRIRAEEAEKTLN